MFHRGFVVVRMGRTFARAHFSTPLGALVLGGLAWSAADGSVRVPLVAVAFVIAILAHLLGQAILVWFCKGRIASFDIHALGGSCEAEEPIDPFDRRVIAWGGILVQAAIFGSIQIGQHLFPFEGPFAQTLLTFNRWLLILNLIPLPPLDGYRAWRVLHKSHLAAITRRFALGIKAARLERKLRGSNWR